MSHFHTISADNCAGRHQAHFRAKYQLRAGRCLCISICCSEFTQMQPRASRRECEEGRSDGEVRLVPLPSYVKCPAAAANLPAPVDCLGWSRPLLGSCSHTGIPWGYRHHNRAGRKHRYRPSLLPCGDRVICSVVKRFYFFIW